MTPNQKFRRDAWAAMSTQQKLDLLIKSTVIDILKLPFLQKASANPTAEEGTLLFEQISAILNTNLIRKAALARDEPTDADYTLVSEYVAEGEHGGLGPGG